MAITNGVLAGTYPLSDTQNGDGGLSPGAIVGIVAGIAAGFLGIVGVGILIYRFNKHRKKLAALKSELRDSYYARDEGTSEVPTLSIRPQDVQESATQREFSLGALSRGHAEARDVPSAELKEQQGFSQLPSLEKGGSALSQTDKRDVGLSPPSSPNSPVHTIHYTHEVQTARPQHMSRGHARIVHTHFHGSGKGSNSDTRSLRVAAIRSEMKSEKGGERT